MIHGRMKMYAVQVSRSRNPDSQRRAREGPGAVSLTVTLVTRPYDLLVGVDSRLRFLLRLCECGLDRLLSRQDALDRAAVGIRELRAGRSRRQLEAVLRRVDEELHRVVVVRVPGRVVDVLVQLL